MTSNISPGEKPSVADEDRLPWLESADDDFRDGGSSGRVALLVVFAILLIGGVLWAVMAMRGSGSVAGTGELIAAPEGDYKVKPDEAGGMKVDGEGDTVFAASEGARTEGRINTRAVPEAPVAGKAAAPAATGGAGAGRVVAQVPQAGGRLAAQAPNVPLPQAGTGGGGSALVQLGSFPTEAAANSAWSAASGRFGYLAPLGKSIEKADVGGRTVYRLRVNAGSNGNAQALCGKLKVAGEACFVPTT